MAADKDPKDDITAVGPGADEDPSQQGVRTGEEADSGYQYPEGDDEDSLGRHEAGDERTGHSEESDDETQEGGLSREQKRRRRKREKYERDQRELALLRSRNEQLEREHSRRLAAMESRQTQSDILTIDGRITQTESQIREAESLYVQARRNNDPEAEAEALRVKDQLRDGLQQLREVKGHALRTAQERQTAATQPPTAIDPAVGNRAREWAREHPWFDPKGRDDDSAVAYAIERRVFAEGRLDPLSDEYWEEVDHRLAKRLPERYRDEFDEERPPSRNNGSSRHADTPKRRPGGPTIKVGGRERTLRVGEVFIDEDRRQAMIDAGVWDDEATRKRFLKSYQEYDRAAGRRPR